VTSRVLELQWPDGACSRLPHALLRASCRCAGCTQQAKNLAAAAPPERTPVRPKAAADPDVSLTDIHPVGDGALNLAFSDGHSRGIYPWAYLRELGTA
jgi:DUF971 family protein